MKDGRLTAVLLLILLVVSGCQPYPYHSYRSGDGYYYYGPNTHGPTYYGPF
jgi:hypothetical protein